jgi:YVTN family beta-propeller protein
MLLIVLGAAGLAGAAAAVYRAQPADLTGCLQAGPSLHRAARPVSLGGHVVAANTFASTATIVDLETGRTTTLDTGDDPHEVAVSADGRRGVVSNYGPERSRRYLGARLFVLDLAAGRIERVIETGRYQGLHDLAFRPGHPDRLLVTAQTSGHVIEVDIATGRVVGAIETRATRSHMLAVSPDGNTVYTTNEGSGTISRLDVPSRSLVATFPASEGVEGIAVTADGRELWVGEPGDSAVRVLDAATGAELARFPGFRYPVRIVASPGGERVAISDPVCRIIAVADPATRRIERIIGTPHEPPVMVGEIAADGRTAIASVNEERALLALDLVSGEVFARYPAGWGADGVAGAVRRR